MSASINPLANPKGGKKLCEICQKPAKLQCTTCRVTFYCNLDHQQADWTSIHEKACLLLVSINTPAPSGTLSDQDHHHKETLKKQKHLIEMAHLEAQKWVSMKRFQDVLPAALLFQHWAMQVYGSCAVELVPAYLLLAQANIGLGSLSQAHEYLSKAEWTVMKTADCSHTVLHQLHRTLGRLHAAMGKHTSALTHFANDVYYASEMFGLDSTVTSGGYFLMADVFLKQNKPDMAHSLYTEVAGSWHTHLCKLMDGISQSATQPDECFNEAQCVEADQMLSCILEFEEQCVKPHPELSAMLAHSLAMLWLLRDNYTKALEYGKKAELLIQGLKEQNRLRELIHNLLLHAEKTLNETANTNLHTADYDTLK
ncbi:zinc finger MYND domain-containing protein 12 [Danio aesculapii]|uniref:zinc finger MYND domain-containing protein 12 n=1 Tax=Danio aesculapii TaxID=1142201 RepID=UPI0024BFA5C1|nr:zinc finger MYND domain-containing protein 12 [Danio aesculapii]